MEQVKEQEKETKGKAAHLTPCCTSGSSTQEGSPGHRAGGPWGTLSTQPYACNEFTGEDNSATASVLWTEEGRHSPSSVL